MHRSLVSCALSLALVSGASATVTFWNQNPHTPGADGGDGMAAYTAFGVSIETADDFRVGGEGMRLESVTMIGTFSVFDRNGAPDNLILRVYNKVGSVPGSQVGADMHFSEATIQAENLGVFYFGREAVRMTMDIPDMDLSAGDYFISLEVIDEDFWFWTTSTPDTAIALDESVSRSLTGAPIFNIGTDWTSSAVHASTGAHDLAFSLDGTRIPAPGALALLGVGGLAGMASRRRR